MVTYNQPLKVSSLYCIQAEEFSKMLYISIFTIYALFGKGHNFICINRITLGTCVFDRQNSYKYISHDRENMFKIILSLYKFITTHMFFTYR